MDWVAFLDRIGWDGPVVPDAATLRGLHRAHLLHVPFENLDIARGRAISLAPSDLFTKVVEHRRGGFCYELNGLFSEFLGAAGFRVERLAARVLGADGELGPPFDHMVLRVRLDEDWLVDVGFGDSFVEPLRLEVDRVQPQAGWDYRITRAGDALALQRRRSDSDWASTYVFDLQAHALSEYQDTCRYHETSPASHFTQGDVCTLLTATGRITLSGNRWIESTGNERHERGVGPTETAQLLADRFGIRVDSET